MSLVLLVCYCVAAPLPRLLFPIYAPRTLAVSWFGKYSETVL